MKRGRSLRSFSIRTSVKPASVKRAAVSGPRASLISTMPMPSAESRRTE